MALNSDTMEQTLERLLLERELDQFLYRRLSCSMNVNSANG